MSVNTGFWDSLEDVVLHDQESEALKLHQRAIGAHHSGAVGEAEQLYKQLLQTRFVSSVSGGDMYESV